MTALLLLCLQPPCAWLCAHASTVGSALTTVSRATPPTPAPASLDSQGGGANWVSSLMAPPTGRHGF